MNRLERAYGAYCGDVLREWFLAQEMDGGLTASRVPRYSSLD